MCGSGHKIAGIEITRVRRQTAVHGRVEIALGGFCAAVLGTAFRRICVAQTVSGSPLRVGTTTMVSVLPKIFK